MLIDCFEAKKIIDASDDKNSIEIGFDLDYKKEKVAIENKIISIDEKKYPLKLFQKIAKSNSIYELNVQVSKIAIFDKHYFKLTPIKNSAPTLEIDGIRMHRTKNITPIEDTKRKIRKIKIKKNENILDICTGLGYSAIEAYKRNAKVTTIEKNKNSIEIAKKNPYSSLLFQGIDKNKINLILDDAFDAIKKFSDKSFDAILHDPPRFSLSGELYSEEFYRGLYRVLRKNGRILHYVGAPGSKYRNKDFIGGIKKRMNSVGFKIKKGKSKESVFGHKL